MKKAYKELEMKGKGYKKKLDQLQTALRKHMEQLQEDLVDPVKVQTTLADKDLNVPCDLKKAVETITMLEAQLNPNLDCISEYRQKLSLYNELVEEFKRVQYDVWKKKRLDEFMEGFDATSLKLKEMYKMITLGGDAELELLDSLALSLKVLFQCQTTKEKLEAY